MSHEYTLIVYTSPADGREEEYNDWYDNTHLREFSALPGVIGGRRFQVMAETEGSRPTYAAMYELSSDPAAVFAAMNEGIKDGTVHMSDAMDPSSVKITTLKPR